MSRALSFCLLLSIPITLVAQDQPSIQDKPLPPEVAAARLTLPEGFRATLFAGEPDVVQPIAFTFDDRGRLWVVECLSYPDWTPADKEGTDRVVILEDTNGDGRLDKRTVFLEQGRNLSGIELGFGGVWLCSTPEFIFVPDRNGDDVPDGPPEVLLDGWDLKAKHNVFAALAWGPDGWLWGCNGILGTSLVGPPGTPDDQRIPLNCGVWRYHPTRRLFEAVAWGSTNPWGLDFDDYGQAFITNCVIKHLFHVIPGAHYDRMYGQDLNPHVYGLIESCADHLHWAGGAWQSSRGGQGEHSKTGGGHAHAGAMVYLGDNWPDRYRNSIFMCNIHGQRVNCDTLDRHGSGYVAHHASDFLFSHDPWYRGLQLKYGPDGGVYVTDWSDTGECHDYEQCDRTNGRIFKVTYGDVGQVSNLPRTQAGQRPAPRMDIASFSDAELVQLQLHKNDWHVRQARKELQERAATKRLSNEVKSSLQKLLAEQPDVTRKLRALWALYVIGGLDEASFTDLLKHREPAVRHWAVRLAVEDRQVSDPLRVAFADLAMNDPSPVVRLALASALQRLPLEQRPPIAAGLASHAEDADDANLPLMIWYGIEPVVATASTEALTLITATRIPLVRQYIVRRLATDVDDPSKQLVGLIDLLATTRDPETQLDILRGLYESLKGRRDLGVPADWPKIRQQLAAGGPAEQRRLALALSLIFGDRDAMETLRHLASDTKAAPADRQWAIESLVQAKDAKLPPLLLRLVNDPAVRRGAIRGLAAYREPATPDVLLRLYPSLNNEEQQDAINTLSSRADYALAMLDAVRREQIPRKDLTTFTVRQLLNLHDQRVREQVEKVWGRISATSKQKAAVIADYKAMLTPENLKNADPMQGRAVFQRTCASCHKLFDAGRPVGPELTGSQRGNVDYLLENLVDPNSVIGRDFQMSVIATSDGRVINGIITEENEKTVTVRTATEDVIVLKDEIAERQRTNVSMMPDGMLDKLSDAEVLNLFRYLAGPAQVPLPEGGH